MIGIPNVQTLYQMIPKGTEGGKHFARLVDLLLSKDFRRANVRFTSFNDASGDYGGLDSYSGHRSDSRGVVGFQYKFFGSPLSAAHRHEIKTSLAKAVANIEKTGLTKWVLITPEDFTQSARKAGGGDVEWFDSLRTDFKVEIEIEHWGHKQLMGLLMENPHICLYYYPELVPQGVLRRKTIREVRALYDQQLASEYGDIQFVGMSVYKKDATQGIPIENIYIPLSVITWGQDKASARRHSAMSLIAPGSKSVVLGDPGSGKSTMLRFLALVGINPGLQARVRTKSDERLPILVTIRRYADSLKDDPDLSLLDYIIGQVRADFSLTDVDESFFRYYLDSGNCILLFDGLDELPNDKLKEKVRNRIRLFLTAFTGNSVVVTSRIVGYDTVRFPEKDFDHFRVGSLLVPEIEQFVREWYAVRLPSEKQRNANAEDLIRIIKDPTNQAIRDLAENPLLLAIIALVHRLDATLPDERVVLYEKCTETLLNTWHSYKYAQHDSKIRARMVDDQNLRRMEAIGYWMQEQSTSPKDRAIVSAESLTAYLAEYIERYERPREDNAQLLAGEFIEFVKERAGLLVEVGDEAFSFIHLTFQEYLAAQYLISETQADGIDAVWTVISPFCFEPRWHEVMRLQIAALAPRAKQKLVDRMFQRYVDMAEVSALRLLVGCLLDGAQPVEERSQYVISEVVRHAILATNDDEYGWAIRSLETWLKKHNANPTIFWGVVAETRSHLGDGEYYTLWLICLALGWKLDEVAEHLGVGLDADVNEVLEVLFGTGGTVLRSKLLGKMDGHLPVRNWMLTANPGANLLGTVLTHVMGVLAPAEKVPLYYVSASLITLRETAGGPFTHWITNCIQLGTSKDMKRLAAQYKFDLDSFQDMIGPAAEALQNIFTPDATSCELPAGLSGRGYFPQPSSWDHVVKDATISDKISELVCFVLELRPTWAWVRAISKQFIPVLEERVATKFETMVGQLTERWKSNTVQHSDAYLTAWVIICDIWARYVRRDTTQGFDVAQTLLELSSDYDNATLRLAHWLLRIAESPILISQATSFADEKLAPYLVVGIHPREKGRPLSSRRNRGPRTSPLVPTSH